MLNSANELVSAPKAQISVIRCTSELYDHKATNILREETFCKVFVQLFGQNLVKFLALNME